MNKKIIAHIGILVCTFNITSLLYAPAQKESAETQTEQEITPSVGASKVDPLEEFKKKYPTLNTGPLVKRFLAAISFEPQADAAPNDLWKNETQTLLADLTKWLQQFKNKMVVFNEFSLYIDEFQKRITTLRANKKGGMDKVGSELNSFILYNVNRAIGGLKEAIKKILVEALFAVENVEISKKAAKETATDISNKYPNLFKFEPWGKKLLGLMTYNPSDDISKNQQWNKEAQDIFKAVIEWINKQTIEITKFEELSSYLDDLQKKIGQLASEATSKPRTVKAAQAHTQSIDLLTKAKADAKDELKRIVGLPVE